jgi:phosphatidate cytidylyltransferase
MGRHKMCERPSPKKSWEGFVGGVAGSLAVGALAAYCLDESYAMWMGLAVVVSLSSVVGDLVESMFKRDAGVKDSGNLIPGHGGILDRFDAFILSAPFAFIYLIIVNLVIAL